MTWSYASPFLGMPYLLPSQAQKHVTVNEALSVLDALAQLAVKNRTLTTPPGSPAEGDRHIVAGPATGAWAGKEDQVAAFIDGGWRFHAPKAGMTAWVIAETGLVYFDGSDWQAVPAASDAPLFGVNTTADTTNRLSVSSPASLFSHEGAGHRAKVNKAAAGDTGALAFQTALADRAEIGLIGNDNLSIRVRGGDANWRSAIVVDRDTAAVTLPNTAADAGSKLIAYVRDVKASGSDGGSFAAGARRIRDLNTLTHAVPGIVSLSSNTLTVAAGSYFFRWSCPAYRVGAHRSWLRDTTNSVDLGIGSTETASAADPAQSSSTGCATATLASSTALRLEHRAAASQTTNGFGVAGSLDPEVYATIEIWRL